jgi:methionyl-tRNA formyltransferase
VRPVIAERAAEQLSDGKAVFRIAYFGLPLVACLLVREGFSIEVAVLPPIAAPGGFRLERLLGNRVVRLTEGQDARGLDDALLERMGTPDLLVSWYYSRRLSPRLLGRPRLGAIGAHPSLLPRHRGPNPFFAAIDAGDARTGVSIHRLEEDYDTGDVLLAESIDVGDRDAWQLARALDRPSVRRLLQATRRFANGMSPEGLPQDPSLATWAPEPKGDLLRVEWSWETARVLRRIRALSPVPGLALEIGECELFVTRAAAASDYPRALLPGEAARVGDAIVVRTADGAIALERAQLVTDDEDDSGTLLDAAGIASATALQGVAAPATAIG